MPTVSFGNPDNVKYWENKIAGVVNDTYLNSIGYGVWYFYNCNGTWTSMGEDIGGATVFDSGNTFCEKAKTIIKQAQEKLNCK
ncbi:MAG: hypothetical protein M0P71_12730 [Melioribacteraceae bacterium]|nr:hypothetical protein [Melioribacteraceae bacterium]